MASSTVEVVPPESIPEPYRSLLVHESSMTSTLEQYVGERIGIRIVWSRRGRRWYRRLVVLETESSRRIIEMGALQVDIHELGDSIRERVLAEDAPFGRILDTGGVPYRITPTAYLSVSPHSRLMSLLAMDEPTPLWGRRTEITSRGTLIARVLEVLAGWDVRVRA